MDQKQLLIKVSEPDHLKAEMLSNFHEIVTIEEGKPKETIFKTSKCKRALESTYKFRTDLFKENIQISKLI